MGDLAAAHAAGSVDLADGARAVAQWSKELVPLVGNGDMASIALPADEIAPRSPPWGPDLVLAGINGPRSVLLAGATAPIERCVAELTAEGVRAQVIGVAMAAHSPADGRRRGRTARRPRLSSHRAGAASPSTPASPAPPSTPAN
ncbi:acyltransferase domain-containing protein [Streptomyces sp. KL116D]|uniref:acyltransferase domain-containing protein n=1 Tax=Streptomyces sp. KL116D TaxID=3045152 RepID=UPI003558E700